MPRKSSLLPITVGLWMCVNAEVAGISLLPVDAGWHPLALAFFFFFLRVCLAVCELSIMRRVKDPTWQALSQGWQQLRL